MTDIARPILLTISIILIVEFEIFFAGIIWESWQEWKEKRRKK